MSTPEPGGPPVAVALAQSLMANNMIHKLHGTLLQHSLFQDHEGPAQTGQVVHPPALHLPQMLLQPLHLHLQVQPNHQVLLMLLHDQVYKLNLQ